MTLEVQKITGHETLSMLLHYTHMGNDHELNRLDEIEPAKGGRSGLLTHSYRCSQFAK